MLHVAEKLGISEVLDQGPARVTDVARDGLSSAGARTVLRALRDLGMVGKILRRGLV